MRSGFKFEIIQYVRTVHTGQLCGCTAVHSAFCCQWSIVCKDLKWGHTVPHLNPLTQLPRTLGLLGGLWRTPARTFTHKQNGKHRIIETFLFGLSNLLLSTIFLSVLSCHLPHSSLRSFTSLTLLLFAPSLFLLSPSVFHKLLAEPCQHSRRRSVKR